ncbi:hypothetical protein EDD85DRAFT_855567 [Armillaria nabsnona]|nr:hypothetical protein EDD85DRAFT_855567 [Armillaria nabsnona]
MAVNRDSCPTCGARNLRQSTTQPPLSLCMDTIQTLRSTNDAPLEHEKPALFDIIQNSKDILVDLDSRISEAQDILYQLITERTQATANLRDAKSLLHPIRRLPDELLRRLFTTCTPSPEDCVYDTRYWDALDENTEPWTLSQTCQRWRRIALDTSRLWSRIDLDLERYQHISPSSLAIRLGTHIDRSRGHDLALSFVLGSEVPADFSSHPLFPVLLSCVSRWKFFLFSAPYEVLKMLVPCQGLLDALCFLHIDFENRPPPAGGDTDRRVYEMFRAAPRLRCVQVCGLDDPQRVFLLPWSQLTVYDGSDSLEDEQDHQTNHMKVLPHMRNLLSLRMYCDRPSTIPLGPVYLPLLQNLILLEGISALTDSAAQCFSLLSAPALTGLQLLYAHYSPISFPIITNPDTCAITTLELVCRFDSSLDNVTKFCEMLSSMPALRRLAVRAHGCTAQLFLTLKCRSDGDTILPCLTFLDLRTSTFTFTDPTVFVDMVESRRPPSMTGVIPRRFLEGIKLNNAFDMSTSLGQRWQRLCDGGLRVQYGTDNGEYLTGPDAMVDANEQNTYDQWFPGMPLSF